MSSNDDAMLALIDAGDFKGLFIEHLGWSKSHGDHLAIPVDEAIYDIEPVAQYRGIRVWACNTVPDRRTQRLIDGALRKEGTERLVIFRDSARQEWKWPMSSDQHGRGQGRLVTHEHCVGKRTEALLQRLAQIRIGIDEENPSVVEIVARLRKAFDADRVTSDFYNKFSMEAENLTKTIRGISIATDRGWYAALLMNRLMFIYFMQRKGFMDGRLDYLGDSLRKIQSTKGPDKFFEFYTDFLLPLFHDGLGSSERPLADSEMADIIGDVPYINGGIFSIHPLEREHTITIPDRAFESIFTLFDAYQWHLDDRPSGNPTEINPDVLGYIFEKFINNKEQNTTNREKGAYYTKDDVTYFMTSSALIPSFLEKFTVKTGINPWAYVTGNPDQYIWDGLKYGAEEHFPVDVAAEGGAWPRPTWGQKADEAIGLPGETWWEVDFRRTALANVTKTLMAGDVKSVDDAITENIDLETLAVDVIDGLDSPENVAIAWDTLTSIKIVDPTCGSGAFLFAALKILEVLYSAVLDAADRHAATSGHAEVKNLLDRAADHPSRAYFILKHASLSNLYGVDIMREAVEIARLRLFLKLVSVVATCDRLEPLPDLDFNIKPGNILVGAHAVGAIGTASGDLFSARSLDDVVEAAEKIAEEYKGFQEASESGDNETVAKYKERLNEVLESTRAEVDRQYHKATVGQADGFAKWQKTHQPFHWFIEFPEVFANGGFDVVIGNPPYVRRTDVKGYTYRGFRTDALPDIYAPCVERATQIINANGRFAMILPISAQFSKDFSKLRDVLEGSYGSLWVSTFTRNPTALFDKEVRVRPTIVVGSRAGNAGVNVTKTHRWVDEYRAALFETLRYLPIANPLEGSGWIRLTSQGLSDLLGRLVTAPGIFGSAVLPRGGWSVGFKGVTLYWLSVFQDDPLCYEPSGEIAEQTGISRLYFANNDEALLSLALLASKIAYVWWYCTGDDFHVTQKGLYSLPIDPTRLSTGTRETLIKAARALIADFPNHEKFTKNAGKLMGNYDLSEMRDITDRIDLALAKELGYEELLPDLEHAYYCTYKPTKDRSGTLRENPFATKGAGK